MVIYHVKFSKEMLIWIYIHTHTHRNTHSLQISHTLRLQSEPYRVFFFFFFLSFSLFFLFLSNQGEYFSPEEKQTGARAGIRGQWCVFKETFPPLAAPLSWLSPRGILMSGGRERGEWGRREGGDDKERRGRLCQEGEGQPLTDPC